MFVGHAEIFRARIASSAALPQKQRGGEGIFEKLINSSRNFFILQFVSEKHLCIKSFFRFV